ncbi:importin subunit alpha-1a-like isoform X3 [Macadamia integrifolia]|uniref:importin subunit alpha-1a-like isoform X3 n=1 Tax=Macadamia integrifolia TaxID=60698 RepID=UPI001C4EE8B0|nr:importin subunit alpha-1a-like isoform X3 [Macadamia integrifolia]
MVADVWCVYDSIQLLGATQIRKLLSIEKNQPIEEVVQSGIVHFLVQFLERENFPLLQIEAAWPLANIASGTSDHTQAVIDHGAVPVFVKLLGSPSDVLQDHVVWALANIVSESPRSRDVVLSHGALNPLLAQLNGHTKLSMLRTIAWTLSNFFRGTPPAPFEQPYISFCAHSCPSYDWKYDHWRR